MEINDQVFILINLLIQVVLWSMIISSPFIILTLEMYGYEKYKKWKNTEEKEYEKIIVGKANNIVKQDEELQRQAEDKKKLEFEIDLLKIKKKTLQEETDTLDPEQETITSSESSSLEEVINEEMSVNELKSIAKKKGIKGYSKKSKKQLLNILKMQT